MKKIIILLLTFCSVLCFSLGLSSCVDNTDYSSSFNDEYQAEYGEMFYFDTIYLEGKSLSYTVKANGQEFEVKDYGFLLSYNGDYTVEVRFAGESQVIKQFTIKAIDKKEPQVSFSYYRKIVEVGEQVTLPTVTIADNFDEICNVKKSLELNGQNISYDNEIFTASEYGDYIYSVIATDSTGNFFECRCVITSGTEYDKDIAINWTLEDSPLDYTGTPYLTTYDVTDEKAHIGTDTSLKVTFTEEQNERCLILKNSLINDISKYDYMCFYVYNDMTNTRQLSFNWTNTFNLDLPRGEWTPIVLPISEKFVTDSQNAAFRTLQDWKNLNGQRFYIQQQNLSTATGSIYLSDVYLVNAPNVEDFTAKAEELNETSYDSAEYSSLLSRVVLEYNILKSTASSSVSTIAPYYNQIIENYFKNALGEKYSEDILAVTEDVSISQLIAYGDVWSKPASVIISDKYAYGDQTASFEITFTANRKYANVKLQNPFAYRDILSGEISFYVKNTTNSVLEIYTDGGRFNTIQVSNEWQKVVISCSTLNKLSELPIRLRGINETIPEPDATGSAKVYFSNICVLPLENEGVYANWAEDSAAAKKWVATPEVSTEQVYGTETKSLKAVSGEDWANGIFLNVDKIAGWLSMEDVASVSLTLSYYVTENNGNSYFVVGNQGKAKSQAIGALNTWHTVTFRFSLDDFSATSFAIGLCKNSTCEWSQNKTTSTFYISNISYKINYFIMEGIYADWSKDIVLATTAFESVPTVSTEQVYCTEKSSIKASSSGWANGIRLDINDIVSWLSMKNVGSVSLTFKYYVTANSGNKYFVAGNQDVAKSQEIGALNTWNVATFTFTKADTAKPLSFFVGFSSNSTMSWSATNTTSTFYLGNIEYKINILELQNQGVYADWSNELSLAKEMFESKPTVSTEQVYGAETTSVKASSSGWANGIGLNVNDIVSWLALENVDSITLTFSYYVTANTGNKYFVVGNQDIAKSQEIGALNTWHTATFTFTAEDITVPVSFIVGFSSNSTMSWSATNTTSTFYLGNISYLLNFAE